MKELSKLTIRCMEYQEDEQAIHVSFYDGCFVVWCPRVKIAASGPSIEAAAKILNEQIDEIEAVMLSTIESL